MQQPRNSSFSLRLSDGRSFVLAKGVKLSGTDLPGLHSTPPGGPVAALSQHPNDPAIVGLQNLSHLTWQVRLPNGQNVEARPGRSIRLDAGTRIGFGTIQGEIETAPGSGWHQAWAKVSGLAQLARRVPKAWMWSALAGVLLLAVALPLGKSYNQRRLAAAEEARRARIAAEQQQSREEARKKEERFKLEKQEQQRAAGERAKFAEEKRRQEEESARKVREEMRRVEEEKARMAAALAQSFNGVWVADGPAYGELRTENDPLTARKTLIGKWHVILEISGGTQARLTKEVTHSRDQNSAAWFDMEKPYNEVSERYMQYATGSSDVSVNTTDSTMTISWSEWKLEKWRPENFPQEVLKRHGLADGPMGWKMRFQRTGVDEITSADWVFKRIKSSPQGGQK